MRNVDVAPCRVDGAIARLVSEDDWDFVEVWTPQGWVRSDNVSVREVLMAPPASPATLAEYGVTETP